MKAVLQRVSSASLSVGGETVSEIGEGLAVYLGVEQGDSEADAAAIAKKICAMRIFEDDAGKMNLSVKDKCGEILLISQFTLCADTSHGNRPSFIAAETPTVANALYMLTRDKIAAEGVPVKTGVFGADMRIRQCNEGPVTIILRFKDGKVAL